MLLLSSTCSAVLSLLVLLLVLVSLLELLLVMVVLVLVVSVVLLSCACSDVFSDFILLFVESPIAFSLTEESDCLEDCL